MTALIACLAVSMALVGVAEAADLNVVVRDQKGEPLPDAVVVAVPGRGVPPPPARPRRETVDQIDKEFVPHVKAVVVGSPVFSRTRTTSATTSTPSPPPRPSSCRSTPGRRRTPSCSTGRAW